MLPCSSDVHHKPLGETVSPILEFFRALVGAFQGQLISRRAVGWSGATKLLESYIRDGWL
jgi:hypothetical protein